MAFQLLIPSTLDLLLNLKFPNQFFLRGTVIRKGRTVSTKHFDESDQSEYLQMLRCIPSSELSRHAVELEKRSMQLSVEEAKEIQKMKALNILGK